MRSLYDTHKCTYCSFKAVTSYDLNKHVLSWHTSYRTPSDPVFSRHHVGWSRQSAVEGRVKSRLNRK